MKKIMICLIAMTSIPAFSQTNQHLFSCSPDGQAQMFYIATKTSENSTSLDEFIAKKIGTLGLNCLEVSIDQIPTEYAAYTLNYNFKTQYGLSTGRPVINRLKDKYIHELGYVVTLNYKDSQNDQPILRKIEKDFVVLTSNELLEYDRLAEKKIRVGLKKVLLEIKRDQNQE